MVAGFKSERWPASNRNRWPDCVGIRNDSDKYVASLEVRAIKPVIPPKANRKVKRDCDFALYAERNLVERFFQFIKQFRGIATRYEKTARNFLAGLQLVCALAWLK
jgi:transposase